MAYRSNYGGQAADLIMRQSERDAALSREAWGTLGNIGVASVGAYRDVVQAEAERQRLAQQDEYYQYQLQSMQEEDARNEALREADVWANKASAGLSDLESFQEREVSPEVQAIINSDPNARRAWEARGQNIVAAQEQSQSIANAEKIAFRETIDGASRWLDGLTLEKDWDASDVLRYQSEAPGAREELRHLGLSEEDVLRKFPMLEEDFDGNSYFSEANKQAIEQTAREARDLTEQLSFAELRQAVTLERSANEPLNLVEREEGRPHVTSAAIMTLNGIGETTDPTELASALQNQFAQWKSMQHPGTALNPDGFEGPSLWPSVREEMEAKGLDKLLTDESGKDETSEQYLQRVAEFADKRTPQEDRDAWDALRACTTRACRDSVLADVSAYHRAMAAAQDRSNPDTKNAFQHRPSPDNQARAFRGYQQAASEVAASVFQPTDEEITKYMNKMNVPSGGFSTQQLQDYWLDLPEGQQLQLMQDSGGTDRARLTYEVYNQARQEEVKGYMVTPAQAERNLQSANSTYLLSINAPRMSEIQDVFAKSRRYLEENAGYQKLVEEKKNNEEPVPPIPTKAFLRSWMASAEGKWWLQSNYPYFADKDTTDLFQYLNEDGNQPAKSLRRHGQAPTTP